MSLKPISVLRRGLMALVFTLPTAVLVSNLGAAENRDPSAGLFVYSAPDGESYFALALKAGQLPATEASSRDHVILVDTSASQIGEHRQQAFDVLEAFLKSLPTDHRVSVMAVDVGTKELTGGFVPAQGNEVETALNGLQRRVPLGATNLQQALNRAITQIGNNKPASIVYIGDGMSTANLIQSAQLRELLKQLNQKRIPVHSFAVGARTDLNLLGILAQHTGGMVLVDRDSAKEATPISTAKKLVSAVQAPVYFPSNIEMQPGNLSLLPEAALPLRQDRETIYLGRGTPGQAVTVSVAGTLNGQEHTYNRQIASAEFQESRPFLAVLCQRAEADKGLSVSLAGVSMMEAAREEFEGQVAHLVSLGEEAVVRHKPDQAEAIVDLIRKHDPANPRAGGLLEAAAKLRGRRLAQVGQAPPRPNAGGDDLQSRENPPQEPKSLLEEEKQRRNIIAQKLTLEVSRTIEQANAMAGTDAAAALVGLKQVLATVLSTTDVDPAVRQQLLKRVRNGIQDITIRQDKIQQAAIQATQRKAQADAKSALIEEVAIEETKLEDLIDQVRAAITRGVKGDDNAFEEAEAIAEYAVNVRPGNGPAAAALFTSEAAGQINKAFRWRALRADRFLATLEQVEISHVPFPDEPPIRWPAPAVWKALTERRQKWKDVDLKRESKSVQAIRAALDRTQDFDLIDMPLRDAVDHLRETIGINIMLDTKVLEESSIDMNEVVNFQLSGVTLRSALRIILDQLSDPLTYIIEHETMKITTLEEADARLSTRVYPVGDLVVTPDILRIMGFSGGGGGGLGGGGMMGGGMMGGGMMGGGMGGGMMGGGMGGGFGGGGGFFSVPPETFSTAPASQTSKKKP